MLSALAQDLNDQLARKLYALPVLVGLGIALYFVWPHEPHPWRAGLLTVLLVSLALWVRAAWPVRTILFFALVAAAVVACGFGAASMRAHTAATPMIDAPLGPTGITGRIKSLEQLEGGDGYRLVLDQLTIRDMPVGRVPHAIRLNIRRTDTPLQVHQWISVFAKIEPASPPTTPGGFDFRRHAYFKQIGGYGYVLGSPRIIDPPATQAAPGLGNAIMTMFENTRNAISARVNATLEPRQAGMVGALLTGERAAINEEDWQALRDSGLAHLLAISGANVDMVALIVFFLARLVMAAFPSFAERHPIKKYAAVVAFLAALLYVLLILPSTPTLRALLMVTIVLLAVLLDRSPISLRLVCATALVILLVQPEQLLSPSFQLSFAAVTALVAVFEILAPWLKRVHRDAGAIKRMLMYLVGVCGTTVIATLATAPISLYHFQTLALYGVIANAVAVPIMTFLIMPLAILIYPLMSLGLDASTLRVLGGLCDVILDIAHATAQLPGARLTPPAMPQATFLLIITAGLVACLLVGRLRMLALVPLVLAVCAVMLHERPVAVVLQNGKAVMARAGDSAILTTTRRYARRQQKDWVRYWGGDEVKGAVIDPEGLVVRAVIPPQIKVPATDKPVAIYADPPRAVMIKGRGQGRLWE